MSGVSAREKGHYLDWTREGHAAAWRYVVAVVLGFLAWIWGSIPVMLLLNAFGIDVLQSSIAFLYTFVAGYAGILLIVRLLLGRPSWSVALPAWPPALRLFVIGLLIQLVTMVAVAVAMVYVTGSVSITWRGMAHVTLATVASVLVALLGLLIQTGFEELFFRGLLAQATYRFLRGVPFVIGLQAFIFASMHTANIGAWHNASLALVPYVVPALLWGWIAWRTGSLLIPMGMHLMNNAYILLFVETEGDVLHGIAPMVAKTPTIEQGSIYVVCLAVLGVIAVEFMIRRNLIERRVPGS